MALFMEVRIKVEEVSAALVQENGAMAEDAAMAE